MKTTRNLLALIAAVSTALTATADVWESRDDVLLKFQGLSPAESEDWDSGAGLELQGRFWSGEDAGVALAVGLYSWRATSDFVEESDDYGYAALTIDGDASLVPVGISGLYKAPLGESVSLIFEAGVRYVFVDSKVSADIYYEDYYGTDCLKEDIEIDDFFMGVLGLSLEAQLDSGFFLQAGLGYQFDLGSPNESFLGEDIGPTRFNAGSVHLGCAWLL
ncbi:MAG: hypothetical protein JXR37_17030 [Kiritimatiellae bacterium]|nr:hypothetical protein [Kiritimatiellia bacterium]